MPITRMCPASAMSVVIEAWCRGVTYYINAEPLNGQGVAGGLLGEISPSVPSQGSVVPTQGVAFVPESGANGWKSEFLHFDCGGPDSGFMEDRAVHRFGELVALLLWRGQRFGEFDHSRDEPGKTIPQPKN